jgi:protein gp37
MHQEWVIPTSAINAMLRCTRSFIKQWGGVQKKRFGRTSEGQTWDEMPHLEGIVPDESKRAFI